MAQRPDLSAAVAAATDDDKAVLDALCEQALEAGGSSTSATLGTALHKFAERVDGGEDVSIVPAAWRDDIAAYTEALASAGINVVLIEQVCVCPELEVAGTFDRIVELDGRSYILDLKTGQSLDFSWGGIAIQLSIYSRAETIYDPEAKTHSPMPAVDRERAIVAHVPAGQAKCDLYLVDIEAGWEGALLAREEPAPGASV